jgi:hypothetical protein
MVAGVSGGRGSADVAHCQGSQPGKTSEKSNGHFRGGRLSYALSDCLTAGVCVATSATGWARAVVRAVSLR